MLTAVGVNLHRNKLIHLHKGIHTHTFTHTHVDCMQKSLWHTLSHSLSLFVLIGNIICQPRSDLAQH